MEKKETGKAPVNPPKGWMLKKEFIDETGQIFKNGRYAGTVESPEETVVPIVKEEQVENMEQLIASFPPELIKKLEESFSKANEEKVNQMLADFKASLEKTTTAPSSLNAEDLAEALVRAQQFQDKKGMFYRNVKDIDPKDYDPAGCVFTSYGTGYVIVDDVRQGQPIKTPYGRMFIFKQSMGRITKIGPHAETYSSLCSFHTNSRKEIEWLKKHRKYQIEFFTDSQEALDANVMAAKIITEVSMEIRKKEQGDILSLARAHGIELGGDLDGIINKLIRKIAGDRVEKMKSDIQSRFREAAVDNAVGGKGITF